MRELLTAAGILVALAALRGVTALLGLMDRDEAPATPTRSTARPVLRVLPGGLSTQREEAKRHG
ncbi:hypothetical protein [Corallococcus sp. AS-1-6]|uniref:hypothetical protein n=1 Tax=Corallococcus sp. AS-1-6 TaxID=2874599 RepID=UPI001CBFF11B|nr:hypothetical protein [Corallococcus sp. AS-1-6]MBZ4373290.1 hypothetical protein [Corallococcus sp. AS-1-6]